MKKLVLVSVLAAGAAAQADTFFDQARVRHVEPQYQQVSVPRQECTTQLVTENQRVGGERNMGGLVIGGVIGAMVGNQVGKGHGREAATALGAVGGAIAGDQIANQGRVEAVQPVSREVQACRTVQEVQNRITGYRVFYEWRGMEYSTLMREHPGHTVRVRVSVDPA